MEWLQKILSGFAGGKTLEEIQREIQTELPKHFKPAKDFNDRAQTIENLKGEIETLKNTQKQKDEEYENYKKGSISQTDYEAKVAEITSNSQKELAKVKLNSALDLALINAGARNVKASKALLNLENVKLDGETLIGLNEQLEELKKSDAYLFNTTTTVNKGNSTSDFYTKGNNDNKNTDEMTDEEYFASLDK